MNGAGRPSKSDMLCAFSLANHVVNILIPWPGSYTLKYAFHALCKRAALEKCHSGRISPSWSHAVLLAGTSLLCL